MESIIACPACGQKMRLANEWLGQSVACTRCQHEFVAKAIAPPSSVAAPASRSGAGTMGGRTQRIRTDGSESRVNFSPGPKPRDDDRTTIMAPPSKKRLQSSDSFTPIPIGAVIEPDSSHTYKGNYRGQIAPEGLQLTGRAGDLFVPVGSSAEYAGESSLRVLVGNAQIGMRITRKGGNVKKLASDLADFLNGNRPSLKAKDYEPSKLPLIVAMILAIVGGIGLLLGIVLVIWGMVEGNWTTFTSPAGRFSVELPGNPKETVKQVPLPIGPPMNATEYRYQSGNMEYLVEYVDLPQRIGIDFLHAGFQSQIAKDIPGGSLKTSNKLGPTSYEYQISITPNGHATRRLIIEGNRVYILTIAGPSLREGDERIGRFMNSFKITGQ